MTKVTRDPREVARFWAETGAGDIEFSTVAARSRASVAVVDKALTVIFEEMSPGIYGSLLAANGASSGPARLNAINRSVIALFANTPAYVIVGHVEDTNANMRSILKKIHGAFHAGTYDGGDVYKITLASLAKSIGVEVLAAKIEAAGQGEKAAKLRSAYAAQVPV
ncbi:MAG: hypothetical protein KC425_10580 [Anaerolineales bacterium]|nr:hypothetical protein [Anaerolineales bacterium]